MGKGAREQDNLAYLAVSHQGRYAMIHATSGCASTMKQDGMHVYNDDATWKEVSTGSGLE